MPDKQTFKTEFDRLATNGSIGAIDGLPAYAYIRVSSDEQADEGRSGLPRQIQHIHEVAAQKGYSIPWELVYADDFTGFEFEDRPALAALRKAIKAGGRRANTVIIESLDRLSRNADWHQGFLLDEMKQQQVEVVFWKTFSSRIERTVMGAIAQDGMEQAQERMRDGNRRKAKERKCVTAKFAAMGLKLVDPTGQEKTQSARKDTKYAIDENRSALIDFIFDALAYQDMTTYTLVNALDKLAETDPRFRPQRAKGWSEGRIVQMVKNPVYKGEFIANRHYREVVAQYDEKTGTYRKAKKWFERPEHEWVRISVPAIVDAETWDRANKNLWGNKHRSPKNRRHDYLLTGLVRCAACGWRYHGQSYYEGPHCTEQSKPSRYGCSKKSHIAKQRNEPRCGAPSLFCDTLDTAVWQIIVGDFFGDPERMMRALDAKYCGDEYQEVKSKIAYLEGQIGVNIKTEADEHALYLAGGYTPEEFAAERRSLMNQREKLQSQIKQLQSQILTPEQIAAKKREALQLIEAMRHIDPRTAPFEVRQRTIRALVDEITLNTAEGSFEMTGALGTNVYRLDRSAVTTSG